MAIFMTSVVIAIASISNDNLQDLKTGQLVGATPWRQQIALLLGSVAGAVAIAPVLNLLYQAYGFTGALPRAEMDPNAALSAPQATLMTNTKCSGYAKAKTRDLCLWRQCSGHCIILGGVAVQCT